MQSLRHERGFHLFAFRDIRLFHLLSDATNHADGKFFIAFGHDTSENSALIGLNNPTFIVETDPCVWLDDGQIKLGLWKLATDFR